MQVSFVDFLPHSLTLSEAIATGDLMKRSITLSKTVDFSEFEHCWKYLG